MLPDISAPVTLLGSLFFAVSAFGLGWLIGRAHRALQRRNQLNHVEAIRQGMLRHAAADDHHHRARMGLTQGD